jgi:hypothetical protein
MVIQVPFDLVQHTVRADAQPAVGAADERARSRPAGRGRELETGTFRYAWTQSFGRWRWTLANLVPLAVVVAAGAGAFSVVFSWYFQPFLTEGNQTRSREATGRAAGKGGQHDLRPQRQGLRGLSPPRPPGELVPLRIRQLQAGLGPPGPLRVGQTRQSRRGGDFLPSAKTHPDSRDLLVHRPGSAHASTIRARTAALDEPRDQRASSSRSSSPSRIPTAEGPRCDITDHTNLQRGFQAKDIRSARDRAIRSATTSSLTGSAGRSSGPVVQDHGSNADAGVAAGVGEPAAEHLSAAGDVRERLHVDAERAVWQRRRG